MPRITEKDPARDARNSIRDQQPGNIPKSVLEAEQKLRKYYPRVYIIVSGYRNCRGNCNFDIVKWNVERIIGWDIVGDCVLQFFNIPDE